LAKINVDGKEYDLEALSPETRAEFEMLFFTEQRMRELQKELAILQTARAAYGRAFQEKLQSEPIKPLNSLE
jgi:hypothetical protein